jgi:hypothetical protein
MLQRHPLLGNVLLKHTSAAMTMDTTIRELMEAAFSSWYSISQYKKAGQSQQDGEQGGLSVRGPQPISVSLMMTSVHEEPTRVVW